MTMALSRAKLQTALKKLQGWKLSSCEKIITKSFTFSDFSNAWNFMNKIAEYAQEINHHPDWSNSFSKVDIALTTHEISAISEKDIDLALKIECNYKNYH